MEKWEAAKSWCESHVGCPYIMGATGQMCTPSYRQARMAQYPAYADKMKKNCPRLSGKADSCVSCRWADPETGRGKLAYDCAQLSRWCMDFVGISFPSGATSQWNKVAWAERGKISELPKDKVCCVFRQDDGKMGHVGMYQGDGWVIHAKGHDYGVVRTRLSDDPWTHYGIPVGLYDEPYTRPTLRRGDNNQYVKIMQTYLVNDGYKLKPTKSAQDGCDGIFGQDTEATLMAFQAEHGLAATGICDQDTWTKLEFPESEPPTQDTPPEISDDNPQIPPDDSDYVSVKRETLEEIRRLASDILSALNTIANG